MRPVERARRRWKHRPPVGRDNVQGFAVKLAEIGAVK